MGNITATAVIQAIQCHYSDILAVSTRPPAGTNLRASVRSFISIHQVAPNDLTLTKTLPGSTWVPMPSLVLIGPAVRPAIGNIQTDKQTYRPLVCRLNNTAMIHRNDSITILITLTLATPLVGSQSNLTCRGVVSQAHCINLSFKMIGQEILRSCRGP